MTAHRCVLLSVVLLIFPRCVFAELDWMNTRINYQASAEDGLAKAAFEFTNNSERDVTITSLKSSCGCTTAELEKKTYEPGESGEVTAVFVFGDRVGRQRKRVQVHTRETGVDGKPVESLTTLELRVTIPQTVKVHPRLLFWNADDRLPKVVQVQIDYKNPIHVTDVVVVGRTVTAELRAIENGETYEVIVTPVREGASSQSEQDPSEGEADQAETEEAILTTGTKPTQGDDAQSKRPDDMHSVIQIKTDFPESDPRTYKVIARVTDLEAVATSSQSSSDPSRTEVKHP